MSRDIYAEVTERMIHLLEQGVVPWRKPWSQVTAPRNLEGHVYRGINTLLLLCSGYESPFWMTFRQASERGGKVTKGEKGTLIVFWKRIRATDDDGEVKVIPLLRHYYVWNLEQTEGVTLPQSVAEWQPPDKTANRDITEAELIVKGYPNPPKIRDSGSDAHYDYRADRITVPPKHAFDEPAEFYSTLFHEMGHSTGHSDRLARKIENTFGSHDYGREELVAEMTAAFLMAECGQKVAMVNSAAYLQSWIGVLREDERAVVTAAGAAQRAADHILGRTFGEESNG